ncbi:MAG: hypothetical protein GDA51_05910 [Ekhidna sp.]|nr:hypothetical protein [Ekhidna sp.]MBC6425994.1 hypothetical protein [Ekhidna sp.]
MMLFKRNILCLVGAYLLCSSALAGDILTLNNEMIFEGKIVKIKDCAVVFKSKGEKYVVPANDIFSLQFEDFEDPVYINYLKKEDGEQDNKCLNASLDAKNHGRGGIHFLLGFFTGPLGMIGTALLANPSPYNGARTAELSENKEDFDDPEYLRCYKKKVKGRYIGKQALGLGTFVAIPFMIFFVLL